MIRKIRPLVTLTILAIFLAGCQSSEIIQGNIIDPEAVDKIKVGTTTSEQVQDYLGSPTLINSYQTNRWLYVMDRRFKGKRSVNRVEITFDQSGVVSTLDRNFAEQAHEPKLDRDPLEQESSWWGGKNSAAQHAQEMAEREQQRREDKKQGIFKTLYTKFINSFKSKPKMEEETTSTAEDNEWKKNLWKKKADGILDRGDKQGVATPENSSGDDKAWKSNFFKPRDTNPTP